MIPEPRNCNQDWLKMEKTEGGRICGKCEQKMVDFSKMNWNEIERVHAENPGQCGMYSQKQLNHWGYEPPSIFSECSKVAIVFSSLFAGIGFQAAEAKPLVIEKEAIHFSPVEMRTDSISEKSETVNSIDSIITIKGKIIDEKTKKPIRAKVRFLISPHNQTMTNSEGIFEIQVEKNKHFKHNVLQIESDVYHTRQIDAPLLEGKFLEIPLKSSSEYIQSGHKSGVISFGVPMPTPVQRMKSRVKIIMKKRE